MFENMDEKEWLQLNSSLQKKKNKLRASLYAMGMLKREGNNDFDHYTYFSEAQYKLLFNELLSSVGLELKFTELSYDTFEGTEKQANGRMPKLEFTLFDIETGFFEKTIITGEGIDKGDKAGYKAYTGALKYYLADTFMVATGDDPEKESPDYNMNRRNDRSRKTKTASREHVDYILKNCTQDQIIALLDKYHIDDIAKLTEDQASRICIQLNERKAKEMEKK